MSEYTAKELLLRVKHMDAVTQDALTRFYLRLLRDETWSYQLRKENVLMKEQSQEAYRKKLNKFVRVGFLARGRRYFVDGKPRNPFRSNVDVIRAIIDRYSLSKYECEAAMVTFKELVKDPAWGASLEEKLHSKERLRFLDTIFPLVFMGREISRFFLSLLFTSVSRSPRIQADARYRNAHGLILEMLSNVDLDIPFDGVDYVGKRIFLDVYMKDVMMLLYAVGANEKHWDTMKVAILEDLTIPLLMPLKHRNVPEREFQRFVSMPPSQRFDEMVSHISSVKDHFVKEYYGEKWSAELASYVAYAITSSIDNPRDDIYGLLKHLHERYGVTRELVESVAADIQEKIDRFDSKGSSLMP